MEKMKLTKKDEIEKIENKTENNKQIEIELQKQEEQHEEIRENRRTEEEVSEKKQIEEQSTTEIETPIQVENQIEQAEETVEEQVEQKRIEEENEILLKFQILNKRDTPKKEHQSNKTKIFVPDFDFIHKKNFEAHDGLQTLMDKKRRPFSEDQQTPNQKKQKTEEEQSCGMVMKEVSTDKKFDSPTISYLNKKKPSTPTRKKVFHRSNINESNKENVEF